MFDVEATQDRDRQGRTFAWLAGIYRQGFNAAIARRLDTSCRYVDPDLRARWLRGFGEARGRLADYRIGETPP